MQITNSEVCNQVNVGLYKQLKPSLVGEHGYPLTGFVCMAAHVTLTPVLSEKPKMCLVYGRLTQA